MTDECELCAQPVGPRRVIERPMEAEAASLARYFWVLAPARLVFCDAECRVKWHALRRKALWLNHGEGCACVGCMG